MKIEFIGRGSYFAPPFHFTERQRVHEVDKKLGKHLLGNKNFKEILDEEIKKQEPEPELAGERETQQEKEEKASKEKEKYEKAKKASKK